MENKMNDGTQEIPMDATLSPSRELPALKPWTAPTFERMNLKDAMSGPGLILVVDVGCS